MILRGIERSINQIQYLTDQNKATRTSTNPTHDSRKQTNNLQKSNFIILPLSQIKVTKPLFRHPQQRPSQTHSNKKIFVSISKTNRTSQSMDRSSRGTPNLSDLGRSYNYLSTLSRSNKIMNKVEFQM